MTASDVLARMEPADAEALKGRLIDEPDGSLALDLRAGISGIALSIGSAYRYTNELHTALLALDGALGEVPVRRADFWNAQLGNDRFIELLSTKWAGGLEYLVIAGCELTYEALAPLSKSPTGGSLRALTLSYNDVGEGLDELRLPSLESLDLVHAGVDGDGLEALTLADLPALKALDLSYGDEYVTIEQRADEDFLPTFHYDEPELTVFLESALADSLERLILDGVELYEPAARALGSAYLLRLASLRLRNVELGPWGLRAFAEGGGLPALERLDLAGTFGAMYQRGQKAEPPKRAAESFEALARASFASKLRALTFDATPYEPETLRPVLRAMSGLEELRLENANRGDSLARVVAECAPPLKALFLKGQAIGPEGLEALLSSDVARSLESLALTGSALGDRGAAMLAQAPLEVRKLGLGQSGITDRGLDALVAAPWMKQLTVLDLAGNRLGDAASTMLASAFGPELEYLDVSWNAMSTDATSRLASALPRVEVVAGNQDPSRLPPPILDSRGLYFESADGVRFHSEPPPVPGEEVARELFPRAEKSRVWGNDEWVVVWPSEGDKYRVVPVHLPTRRAVTFEPPIDVSRGEDAIDRSGRWFGIARFNEDVLIGDLTTGRVTPVGRVLGYLGGVAFAGERFFVLHADSEGEWEGYLDVYARKGETWGLERTLRGFRNTHEKIFAFAEGRVLALCSEYAEGGVIFVGVRPEGLRVLGYSVIPSYIAGLSGEDFILEPDRFKYRLCGIEEALERAFAEDGEPETLPYPAP